MNKTFKDLKKFWKNKKIFITGHTGFKGTWLTIFLKLLGANISGYSLKPKKISIFNKTDCKKILNKNFYLDINNYNNLKKKIYEVKPNIIFHLAAQPLVRESFEEPINTFQTNIIGTINLLEAIKYAKFVKSVVIITTDKVYKIKNNNKSYTETDELGGKDPYSASKACAEIAINSYIESFYKKKFLDQKVAVARSGNVLGGGDYSKNRLLPDIIRSINSNKEMIVRNPDHIRPWQHVIEPIYGYLLLAQKKYKRKLAKEGHAWNFGPKKSNFVKVSQVISKMNEIKKFKKISIKKDKIKETKILKLNSSKAIKYLNWRPRWSIDKTLKKIIDWNSSEKKKENLKKICEEQIFDYLKD